MSSKAELNREHLEKEEGGVSFNYSVAACELCLQSTAINITFSGLLLLRFFLFPISDSI